MPVIKKAVYFVSRIIVLKKNSFVNFWYDINTKKDYFVLFAGMYMNYLPGYFIVIFRQPYR